MNVLVNDVKSVSTGFNFRPNYRISSYIKVSYKEKEIFDYQSFRDSNNNVFISLPEAYKGELVSIELKDSNNFFKNDFETELEYLSRLSYSFSRTLKKAPKFVLRPGEVRIAFLGIDKFTNLQDDLMNSPYIYKGAFYYLSFPVMYRKDFLNTTVNKNVMLMFKRLDESSETFFSFSPLPEMPYFYLDLRTVNQSLNVGLLVYSFELGSNLLNVKTNV